MTAIDPVAAQHALQANPGLPADTHGPVFREPWEAQAFAMTLALHDKGLFAWREWAAMLGETIRPPRRPAIRIPGTPITTTGWRPWNGWWRRRPSPLPGRPGIPIATPGNAPQPGRGTVSRSSYDRGIGGSSEEPPPQSPRGARVFILEPGPKRHFPALFRRTGPAALEQRELDRPGLTPDNSERTTAFMVLGLVTFANYLGTSCDGLAHYKTVK